MLRLSLLGTLLLLAGCDSAGDPGVLSPEERDAFEREIDTALRALDAAIGDARADDLSACRVLPLGADACGAPTYFRVYSVTDADSVTIERLAAFVDDLDQAYDQKLGLVRECRNTPPPAIELVGGRCRFQSIAVP